jgi:hypothetical protein
MNPVSLFFPEISRLFKSSSWKELEKNCENFKNEITQMVRENKN